MRITSTSSLLRAIRSSAKGNKEALSAINIGVFHKKPDGWGFETTGGDGKSLLVVDDLNGSKTSLDLRRETDRASLLMMMGR